MVLAPAAFFVLGLCVGSFINVAVLRYGFKELPSTRSRCASCDTKLMGIDLVPFFSYLALSGRCRHCGSRISMQYPIVELLTGLAFAGTIVSLPFSTVLEILVLLAYLGFWSTLIALALYDIRHTLIPYPFIAILGAFALVGGITRVGDALMGLVVCGGFIGLIYLLTRGRGMGLGDVFVSGAIGAMLGLSLGVSALTLAVWFGAFVGMCVLLARGHATLKTEIPFAPFLAVGAYTAFFLKLSPLAFVAWLSL